VKIQRNRSPEPTAADLAGIEQEWPLIEAEIALLDAQITILNGPAVPTDLDRQRIRRAQRRVLREATALRAVKTDKQHGRAA
jgi:hypothetical protein